MFASYETHLSGKQIKDQLQEGKFFLACDAMKHGEDEEAVEEFDKLNMAEASYYQAQVSGSFKRYYILCETMSVNASKCRNTEKCFPNWDIKISVVSCSDN